MVPGVTVTVGKCESPGFMSVGPKTILHVRIRSCRRRLTTKLSRLSLAKMSTARKTLCKFALDTFNFADIGNEIWRPRARSIFNDGQHIDIECSQQDLDVPGVEAF